MAEPNISPGDWLSVAATSVLAAVGGAAAWFRRLRNQIHKRVDAVEQALSLHITNSTAKHADHTTQIEVMKACQRNTQDLLATIQQTTSNTNERLNELIQTLLEKK